MLAYQVLDHTSCLVFYFLPCVPLPACVGCNRVHYALHTLRYINVSAESLLNQLLHISSLHVVDNEYDSHGHGTYSASSNYKSFQC